MQVQKLQSIIASRASQYNHDAKRKEREATKLKERLGQLLVDRKDKKLGKHEYTHHRKVYGMNSWPSSLNQTFLSNSCALPYFSYRCTELLGTVGWKKEPLENCKSDHQVA